MIRCVSNISDLPYSLVEIYRRNGWIDEEILENFSDAVKFLNSHLRCCGLEEELELEKIFTE